MALAPKLGLRQTTALVMTPKLQQAIRLLQLSNLELAAYVEEELAQNPLLEREEGTNDEARDGASPESPEIEPRDSAELAESDRLPADGESPLDTDPNAMWEGEPGDGPGAPGDGDAFANWGPGGDFDDGESSLERTLTREATLRERLVEQMNLALADPGDRLIATNLIDLVDESGYLAGEIADVAERLGVDRARVERVLATIQTFDPAGIAARSLVECLTIQLKERDRFDPAMAALIAHLDLLARRDLAALKRVCGVDDEDLRDMIAEVRALDPKPGLRYGGEAATPIVPDVLVRYDRKNGWLVDLNPETLPRVLINRTYHATVAATLKTKAEREYLAERLQAANWLTRALHQRATTILKVATEIIRRQQGFFAHGVSALKPLTLRDIADAVGVHESTVSRVTSNKYMATPRGIFELKYFFTSSLPGAAGADSHSAEAVRFRIKELIEAEARDDVLSDDRIVEILAREGIEIARRTVAKYREALRIPSSAQRRREKAACLEDARPVRADRVVKLGRA
ncbi:MAG TPA: RNA polymerase factor sigma-54 [Alphaproteobacteria bacterium]|nr:RNA polymerase factor sigma-54 [Alphaproteobacteria bacterium]